MSDQLPVTAVTAAPSLSLLENLALTLAKAQLKRGENPPVNTTATLVAALERIAAAAPAIADRAAAAGTCVHALADLIAEAAAAERERLADWLTGEGIRMKREADAVEPRGPAARRALRNRVEIAGSLINAGEYVRQFGGTR